VQELGRLDVMVNNASVEHKMPFLETPLEVWEEIIAVNPRTHHQRLVGARGPGDADQLPLLRRQGRPAHADADDSGGAGAARHRRQ